MKKTSRMLVVVILLMSQLLSTTVYAIEEKLEQKEEQNEASEQLVESEDSFSDVSYNEVQEYSSNSENSEEEPILEEQKDIKETEAEFAAEQTRVEFASGVFGTCPWIIDTDGILYIQEGELGYSYMQSPWQAYRNNITKIIFEGPVKASFGSSGLFYQLDLVTEIQGLTYLDTSNVTNMNGMFGFMRSLKTLDVSGFDTRNVTNMGSMFADSNQITSLNVSNFDTQKVTNMGTMFYGLKNISELDISNFDTRNVTNMSYMFTETNKVSSLDVSNFETKNVKDMSFMFSSSGVQTLELANFDTSKVTNMSGMFANSEVVELDVSNFDTSNVTSMRSMFSDTSNLTWLDLSNFNTSEVTDMGFMFSKAALESVDLSNFDTRKVTNMDCMFQQVKTIQSLKLGRLTQLAEESMLLEPFGDPDEYTGKWAKIGTIDTYSTEDLIHRFDGDVMAGEYIWAKWYSLVTKDLELIIGSEWEPAENVVSLKDQFGNDISLDAIKIDGGVDTSTVGWNMLTFYQERSGSYMSGLGFAIVEIKADNTSVEAKDSVLYVGDEWDPKDNFISATDELGNELLFDNIIVVGAVDTNSVGEYLVSYTNGTKSHEIKVTVKENLESIQVTDSVLYVGDEWDAANNFVSATNKKGDNLSLDEMSITGDVDTSIPGNYFISYRYGSSESQAIVTVKEDQAVLRVRDSVLYVGDDWSAEDNFLEALDRDGKQVPFKKIIVEGEVNTTRPGTYEISYKYGTLTKNVKVIVKSKIMTKEENKNQNNESNLQKNVEEKNQKEIVVKKNILLPKTGTFYSKALLIIGLMMVVLFTVIMSSVNSKKIR